jgi:hypothetical protein
LCSATTCACFSCSGNTEFVIVLFIIFVIGFAITCLASFNNLADIPSLPVAFLTLVLFICLCTNSSDISLNSRFIGTGTFLAHLTQRVMRGIAITWRLSSVR